MKLRAVQKTIFTSILKHKVISGIVIIVLLGGGYFVYASVSNTSGQTRYVASAVEQGTLIVSISGSGQVSASNQVDIKPKASGDITALYAKQGQEVSAGALLAIVDTFDAQKAVRDAQTTLETARLQLDETLSPPDELTLLQAQNALTQAQQSLLDAQTSFTKSYEDGYSSVSNAFINLPDVMSGLQDILFSSTLGGGGQSNIDYYADAIRTTDENLATRLRNDVNTKYSAAREAYDVNFIDYKTTTRFSSHDTISALINETYATARLISDVVQSARNLIQSYQDKLIVSGLKLNSLSNTHLSSLGSYTSTANSAVSSLFSASESITNASSSIVNTQRSIQEKQLSLQKVQDGADSLTIRSQQITLQQKQDALSDAQQALGDHYVRAPFDGVIAKVDAQKGDAASSGSAIATMVTKQQVAEISLNEVDVAQVQVGQKATLTFDAIPDLTISGEVAQVDALGTSSQGVVTYTVKITFDTQDDRVKTGMSVSAAIVTLAKQNVLLVPNAAIKQQDTTSYVELVGADDKTAVLAAGNGGAVLSSATTRQVVMIGSANDTYTEIVSGLSEDDAVVVRTIQPTTAQTATQTQSSSLRIPGISGGSFGR